MGRRKQITDDMLISLIDKYYLEECEENTKLLKTSLICDYIRSNGYPDYKEYILRRNTVATEYIKNIKASQDSDDLAVLAVYKTLDVDSFIENNHSISTLKKSLISLDGYYESISKKATQLFDKNRELKSRLANYKSKIKELEERLKICQEELNEADTLVKNLTIENSSYKEIIDTYVYPEIANELLKQRGLLRSTDGAIKTEAINTEIIHANTPIKSGSNIIRGLFDKFEGN